MLGIGATGVVVDQIAKAWALASLDPAAPRRLLGGLLTLRLVRNPGAAFSLGTRFTWVFPLLGIAALIVIAAVLVPRTRAPWWCVAVGLFISGIAGNLVDRLTRPPGVFRGHVVDFLELPHWPIFNVADMCICAAAGLFVILTLWGRSSYDGKARG